MNPHHGLELSHFAAAFLFALFASVVFGITQRETVREQFRYGTKCFAWFILGLVAGGWAMWLLRH
jgi:hypothetical protein